MNAISNLGRYALTPGRNLSGLRALFDGLDVYRRHVRAGLEIERLLSQSDQQLEACGMKREEVGRAVMQKHGIGIG